MLMPWTWAMSDRMSLVVCSALNTWCCPPWSGGRWLLEVVLWSSRVRYWSRPPWERPGRRGGGWEGRRGMGGGQVGVRVSCLRQLQKKGMDTLTLCV